MASGRVVSRDAFRRGRDHPRGLPQTECLSAQRRLFPNKWLVKLSQIALSPSTALDKSPGALIIVTPQLTTNLHDILDAFGDTPRRRVKVKKRGHAMFATLTKLLRNEDGATAIEYAMVASLVSVVAFFCISSIGNSVSAHFASVANAL